ncbi:hypothetical protein QUA03_23615 [Microcoleus sp. S36b_A4]|uniref:hypothetical protein n=1 Tax=Microcoleus sp. S36b_A4 TaxID=3055420 RepID=UPI002FD6D69E
MVRSTARRKGDTPVVSASSGRSDSLLWALEHPTVGDRAHVAKKEKKMNVKRGKKREDVGTKRRVK